MASIIKLELKTNRKQVPDSDALKVDLGLDTLALTLAANWHTEATLSHLASPLLYQGALPPNNKKSSPSLGILKLLILSFQSSFSLPLL